MAFPVEGTTLINRLRNMYLALNDNQGIGEYSMKAFSFRREGVDEIMSGSPPIEVGDKRELEDLKILRSGEEWVGIAPLGIRRKEGVSSRSDRGHERKRNSRSLNNADEQHVRSSRRQIARKNSDSRNITRRSLRRLDSSNTINLSRIREEPTSNQASADDVQTQSISIDDVSDIDEINDKGMVNVQGSPASGTYSLEEGNVIYKNKIATEDDAAPRFKAESRSSIGAGVEDSETLSDMNEEEDEGEEYNFTPEEGEDFEDDISSSSDSAFTDIETDSILNSSMLTGSFSDTYSFDNHSGGLLSARSVSKKLRKRRSKSGSASEFKEHKHNRSPSQNLIEDAYAILQNSSTLPASAQVNKKNTLTFEKLDYKKNAEDETHISKLSTIINSKHKAMENPLEYFSFAGESENNLSEFSIFIPPNQKPMIDKLMIDTRINIFDSIGYILLTLCNESLIDEKDAQNLNPNHWRLELVDEDGENYGSFGILDRTRQMCSYNNPKEIAICRIRDVKEIERNERQTPLPLVLKQNLAAIELRELTYDKGSSEENMIDLEIINNVDQASPDGSNKTWSMHIPKDASIGQVLRLFCTEHDLDSRSVLLLEVSDSNTSDSLLSKGKDSSNNILKDSKESSTKNGKVLKDTDLVGNLQTHVLKACKIYSHSSLLSTKKKDFSSSNVGITPDSVTPVIAPIKKEAGNKATSRNEKTQNNSIKVTKRAAVKNLKREIESNKYLEEMIKGKNLHLPVNINTIYFRWKVWRRKATLLNRIEKQLIIDGDYVHLTPDELMSWKKNPLDGIFLQSHHHHHHHNYLNHYNYTNYYIRLLMKTSSFHITQIVKLKQYIHSKNPNHFKIVVLKHTNGSNGKDTIKKKYDLEAVNAQECEDIILKLKWARQVYNMSNLNLTT